MTIFYIKVKAYLCGYRRNRLGEQSFRLRNISWLDAYLYFYYIYIYYIPYNFNWPVPILFTSFRYKGQTKFKGTAGKRGTV